MIDPGPRITVVVDEQAREPLRAEHGFALWIESGGYRILFDTGQGDVLLSNSEMLGIDLAATDVLALSHGHYDHTGAISDVLRLAPEAIIYLHPSVFLPRYSIRSEGAGSVRMPGASMSAIIARPDDQVHWTNFPVSLEGILNITGPIPRESGFEDTGGPFFLDPEGRHPDPLNDDLALWFDTGEGLTVCTGCCHSGIVNTLFHIMKLSGKRRIRRVIGGFHLLNAGPERLEKTVEALSKMDIQELIPCHCTGRKSTQYLAGNLECRVTPGYAGMRL